MSLPDLVRHFVEPLERLGAPYMIVGSVASILYGEVRTTQDVDLVLVLNARLAARFAAAFPPEEYYCPPPEVIGIEADRPQRGHFNLLHHETGFKADCHLLAADNAFDRWGLQHRLRADLGGYPVWLAPPECVILGKLEYFREGGSSKHRRDIRAMLASTPVDRARLEAEIARRGLGPQWEACQPPALPDLPPPGS